MIQLLILTLIGAVTAIQIPENMFCCSSELGVFRHLTSKETGCWDQKTNKVNHPRIECPISFNVFSEEDFNLSLTVSGQVVHMEPGLDSPLEFKSGEICFANETISKTNKTIKVLLLCTVEEEDESVLGYCILVSVVFLSLTTVVYAILPEIRDLQGKSIINFCGSMAIGLGILCAIKLQIFDQDLALCATRGFLIYFFLVATFFWSNAIAVQVMLSLRRPVVNNYSWKEFSWYALYAWGCPTILTLGMAIVNFHPGDHKKPGIGLNTCWFYNKYQQWYYMYSVMSILIVVNICIFIYTSVRLWRLSFSSTQIKALRYKFFMTLRMFVVMGVTWIFEMISSTAEKSTVWYIIDLFNALQGPLIFLVLVVFRKRVIKALLRRGYLSCVAGPIERYLALKEDDEEGVIQHTIDMSLNDRNGAEKNGI